MAVNNDFLFNKELLRLQACLYLTKMLAIFVAAERGNDSKEKISYLLSKTSIT